ncbi:hypothetical protein JTB14_026996 [Gonioctena quinquepunctata]|nr:hypothetical protein JTB14_026996 [Gonioctena quinquepunctata]
MQVIEGVRKRFVLIFTLTCELCGITLQIYSDDPRNISGITESVDVNPALTSGAVPTGNVYSTLDEIPAAINMPIMAENTYSHYHDKVSDVICSTAEKIMNEAKREESELARNLGEIVGYAILSITVVSYGALSERSYNVNYTAVSGVVSSTSDFFEYFIV